MKSYQKNVIPKWILDKEKETGERSLASILFSMKKIIAKSFLDCEDNYEEVGMAVDDYKILKKDMDDLGKKFRKKSKL